MLTAQNRIGGGNVVVAGVAGAQEGSPCTTLHIKEALAEAAPISQEIDDLLRSKGVSVWTAIVALAASLGTAAAVATSAGPLKGSLRVAHHYVDSAFWVAYAEFKHSAKG
jgi:hypothetical protein